MGRPTFPTWNLWQPRQLSLVGGACSQSWKHRSVPIVTNVSRDLLATAGAGVNVVVRMAAFIYAHGVIYVYTFKP